jgi:hypothetical protein
MKIKAGDQPNFADPKTNINVGADNYCVQCGRKCGANPLYVEIIKGGQIRLQDGKFYDPATDNGYMGYWAVGNECAKQFESNVLIKMAEAK